MHSLGSDSAQEPNVVAGLVLVPTRFVWPYGGKSVYVSGTFTGWSDHVPMSPVEGCPTVFQAIYPLTPGYHQYKFIVDGEWRHDEHQPLESGAFGIVNTILLASGPDQIPVFSSETLGSRPNMDVDNDTQRVITLSDDTLHDGVVGTSEADLQDSRHRISVFLSSHTAYELLPESGKVIALDVNLPVKQAFHIIYEQGISVAPLWDFSKGQFVGVLSALDFILILREIGKEIVEKCGGLPLVAKALRSLLRFKTEENEWLSIKDSKIWKIPSSSENNILPALMLSYYDLPSQMKQCFVYCSIFPKDYIIVKEELIQLWMANGFLPLPSKARIELEDVGIEIFNALLWRSFFQDVENDEDREIIKCKMHHLVHDLACYIAGDENIVEDNESTRDLTRRTRHVTLVYERQKPPPSVLELIQRSSPFLRSLVRLDYQHHQVPLEFKIFLSNFSFTSLCLLDLHFSGIEVVPDSIVEMLHMRYLDLSHDLITSLPESIYLLRNLQTLKLQDCWELKSLPKNMRKMSSLRYLNIRYCDKLTDMPIGMGQLTCLRKLSFCTVGKESGSGVDELQGLNNLRGELEIRRLEHIQNAIEAKSANLMSKKNLRVLRLEWSYFELEQQRQGDATVEELEQQQHDARKVDDE